MFTLSLYSSSAPFSINPPLHPPTTAFSSSLSKLKPSYHLIKKLNQRRIRNGTCRAEFSHDAPFAVAIGACMLSSLVLPNTAGPDDDSDTPIDSTDARFAVMGIISFVPYFNWLSWVFAWLDTGKRRYVVYSLVYLFPYLRSNLSLSPEESWLPIASIVFCIIHIQLEASIKNGDIQGFQLFTGAAKNLKGHQVISKKEKMKGNKNLPSGEQPGKNEIPWWGVSENPSKDPEHLNEDWNDDDRRKH